jgi:hypothetical protein
MMVVAPVVAAAVVVDDYFFLHGCCWYSLDLTHSHSLTHCLSLYLEQEDERIQGVLQNAGQSLCLREASFFSYETDREPVDWRGAEFEPAQNLEMHPTGCCYRCRCHLWEIQYEKRKKRLQ